MTGKSNVLVLLFRNDLRLHDNPLLQLASASKTTHVLPVWVFDDRLIDCTAIPGWKGEKDAAKSRLLKTARCGPHRTKFLTEAVFDLKASLSSKLGSDLLIAFGRPELVIPKLVGQLQKQGMDVGGVWVNAEVTTEEQTVEKRLSSALARLSAPVDLRLIDEGTNTLAHPADLPFPIKETPDVFTTFRKAVEGLGEKMIRPCLPTPTSLPPAPTVESVDGVVRPPGDKTTLDAVLPHLLKPHGGIGSADQPSHTAFPFKGGEQAALARLHYYCAEGGAKAPIASYKGTRNGMVGPDYSTKFSAFLAQGSLSPRRVAQAVSEWEDAHTGGKGSKDSYWILFELLWSTSFTFLGRKYGSALFREDGFNSVARPGANKGDKWIYCGPGEEGEQAIKKWREGRTGVPLIDANMRELASTGFMSNRGRQNVACYLTKDLGLDWRAGAEVFEELLVDSTNVTSNFGNWQYVAGVGTDPRESRYFNPLKQAKDYDPDGSYVKQWLPELADMPAEFVHHPWTASGKALEVAVKAGYGQAPKEERGSWKGQYGRSAHGGGSGGGGGRGGRGGGKPGRGGGKPRGKGPGGGHGGHGGRGRGGGHGGQ